MNCLTFDDKKIYLCFGNLTQPFISVDKLNKLLKIELNSGKETNLIKNIINIVHNNISYSNEKYIQDQKFNRTAKEIWKSKFTSGCTDTALVFATLARQLGIPTTILHTAKLEWVNKLKSGQDAKLHYGHTFCECFYENKWILVDPTATKITVEYNPQKIVLNYTLGNSNTYLPYFRGIDLNKKMTVREHNEIMDEECVKL